VRLLLIIIIVSFYQDANAQYYLENVSHASIDQKHYLYDSIKGIDFKQAHELSLEIKSYYDEQVESPENLHNYYYYSILELDSRFKAKVFKRSDQEEVFVLAEEIIKVLGKDHIVNGYYQNKLGQMYMGIVGDRPKSREYFEESLRIHKLYLDDTAPEIIEIFVLIAESYRQEENFRKALKLTKEALKLFESTGNTDNALYLRTKANVAAILSQLFQYEEAKNIYLSMLDELNVKGDDDNDLKITIAANLTNVFAKLEDHQSALNYAQYAVKEGKEKFGVTSNKLVKLYIPLSNQYIRIGNLSKAQSVIDSAIYIAQINESFRGQFNLKYNRAYLESNLDEKVLKLEETLDVCPLDPKCRTKHKAQLFNLMGGTYLDKGNYVLANNYFEKAIEIGKANPDQFHDVISSGFYNISEINRLSGDLDSSIDYLEEAINAMTIIENKSLRIEQLKSKLALYQLEYKKEADARKNIKEAIKKADSQSGFNIKNRARIYQNASKYYLHQKKYEKALSYLSEGEKIYESIYGTSSTKLLQYHLLRAQINAESKNKKASKLSLKKILGISGIDIEGENTQVADHNLWQSFYYYNKYLTLESELDALNKEQIIKRINTGTKLLDRLRTHYFFESSEADFQLTINDFFNWSIKSLADYATLEEDSEIYELIFYCIEKNKSINLNRNHQRNIALVSGEIPSKLISREKNINYQYQQLYEKYESYDGGRDSTLQSLIQQMHELEKIKRSFLDSMSNFYPEYFNSRYNTDVFTMQDAKAIAKEKNQGFILFHQGEENFYRFIISPTETNFEQIDKAICLEQLDLLNEILIERKGSEDEKLFKENFNQFVGASYNLYNEFFSKPGMKTMPFQITIIPDGELTTLPFEILLIASSEKLTSYKELPYLITKHSISYLGSISQFIKGQDNVNRKFANQYSGFGPSYPELEGVNISMLRTDPVVSNLKYNVREIEETSKLFGGKIFINEDATESAFFENAKGNKILHLAMHAYVDAQVPMDSYLSFAIDTIAHNDGKLKALEIAKMNLENELVILSACETNKSSKGYGEGLLGLARAFQLAACPNIIMSNWLVDDLSASKIIYSSLEKKHNGYSTANGLREAKLEYLNTCPNINSHPSYWAAFAFYGFHQEDIKSGSKAPWVLALSLLFIAGLFYFFIKNKKSTN